MTDSNEGGYAPPATPLFDQEAGRTSFDTATSSDLSSSTDSASSASDKAGAAKDQAQNVASDVRDAGGQVAGTVADKASEVASEAKNQIKDLAGQTTSELKEQAGVQQDRAAQGLRTLSEELQTMASNSNGGVAGELVSNAAGRAGSVAAWLEGRDPGTLLDDVKSFAARKPGTFIAIAAGAGLLGGRLVKALTTQAKNEAVASQGSTSAPTTPAPSFDDDAAVYAPPIRTEAAYSEADSAIGYGDADRVAEPTFDDLLGDTTTPGIGTDEGQR
jgi:hypothetical protein